MIPLTVTDGEVLAVLGLGRTGISLAHAAKEGGAEVIVWDDNAPARAKAALEGLNVVDLHKDEPWAHIDRLAVSPGIPHLFPHPNPIVANAYTRGVVVDNDIGLFFRELNEGELSSLDPEPRIIAVTGSNGKSTTAALLHHALGALGQNVQLGGNIGRGVFDLDIPHAGGFIVLELSSYQTELASSLTPEVAILTNISPDHLDRHGGMGGYVAAKSRLFMQSLPFSIIGMDDLESRFVAQQVRASAGRLVPVSVATRPAGVAQSVHVKKGQLAEWRKGKQAASIDLRGFATLPGMHNHQNIACAYAALRHFLFAPKAIGAAIGSFPSLAHRCQFIGEKSGVRFINDSKATNADAARHALAAFDNIHWIVGGRPKAGGIAPLSDLFSRVKHSYLIGEATEEFATQLGNNPYSRSGDLETAMREVAQRVEAGDVVLLSPAAASFDQYPDFEKRGEAFEMLAKSIFGV